MQNWFRRKELVSPPYDKCGIFAKQDLEFHEGDLIGSEHRQEYLKREAQIGSESRAKRKQSSLPPPTDRCDRHTSTLRGRRSTGRLRHDTDAPSRAISDADA